MDPYLEQHWRSVHHRLITYAGDQLQAVLPAEQFRVEVEERVFVAGDLPGSRTISPDVYVVQRPPRESSSLPPASEFAEPVVIELSDEPITETYLEIVDTVSGNKVLTAIEFLSPTNKTSGDGSEMYQRKQREYRAAGVSTVEVDLTRQGSRGLVLPMSHIPKAHQTFYLACVRRSWQPARIEAYPLPLQVPLPTIRVPLDQMHTDVPLDLQSLVSQCYRNGRYGSIDYRGDPRPKLPSAEAKWVDGLLREKSLR